MYDRQRLKIAELTLTTSKKGDYEFGFMSEKGDYNTYHIDFEFGHWVDVEDKSLQMELDKQLAFDTRELRDELTQVLRGMRK